MEGRSRIPSTENYHTSSNYPYGRFINERFSDYSHEFDKFDDYEGKSVRRLCMSVRFKRNNCLILT